MLIHSSRKRLLFAAFLLSTTLLLPGCSDSKTPKVETPPEFQPMAMVVYAVRDVPEGNTIRKEDVQDREIDASKIPEDAICKSLLVVGRIAKIGISSGQIITQNDIAPRGDHRPVCVTLTDKEYELVKAQAAKNKTQPENLLHDWVKEKLNH